ncbi:MAG: AAA family ATPase, partial [Dysgonamonadaceae bacterium]|nr:AAA family ATPase [Dysgonamonadaceae bacterium]
MKTKIFKRLPYGISDFRSIRLENYAYVDKTRFIEMLENENNPNQFFIRPRKFGKSLFFMTLSYYYDINSAHEFEQLFGDLYIGQHPTPERNSYLILDFDFSGLDTSDEHSFRLSFARKIENSVCLFLSRYKNILPDADMLIRQIWQEHPGTNSLQIAFNAAIGANQKIFVIIDEYDHFANDLIAMGNRSGTNFYKTMVAANGMVRDFYETIKAATKTSVA